MEDGRERGRGVDTYTHMPERGVVAEPPPEPEPLLSYPPPPPPPPPPLLSLFDFTLPATRQVLRGLYIIYYFALTAARPFAGAVNV